VTAARGRAAVLLDRDGTLIVDRDYLSDPAGVELLPGAAAGLRKLRDLGLALVVVTNQSGIGRGLFDEAALAAVHDRLTTLLAAEGVRLDGIYHCPHAPADDCACRKPRTELALRAARDLGLDLARAFVVGDKRADVELGRALGVPGILVRTGYGERELAGGVTADAVAGDLEGAAQIIEGLLSSGA
jgi:D-glycero-D-manno-heptose 1,7-bisphosphate phosphatase